MPAKVDVDWEHRVKSIKATNRSWGAGRICKQLQIEAAKRNRTDAPSERWVGGILRNTSPEDLAEYPQFYWPESMGTEDLPWEASATVLELLREGDVLLQEASQPSIQLVKFFWRVDQSAHDAPFWLRMGTAVLLHIAEANHDRELERAVQWFLAYEPWRGRWNGIDWAQRYREAIKRPSNPIPPLPDDLMPLYRITGPVLSDIDFLTNVRKLKIEWLESFRSDTTEVSREEKNG